MERDRLCSILESLLFVSERPLTVNDIRSLLGDELEPKTITDALDEAAERLQSGASGIVLAQVAGGYQLRTHPDNAEWVRKLLGAKPVRVSRAALETLAIIAYRQPITRAEIEDVRGVDCGGVLKMLLERRLLRILGKKEEPGRPILYGTSKDFLQFFGLKDLTELPTLREFHELSDDSLATLEASDLEESPANAADTSGAQQQDGPGADGSEPDPEQKASAGDQEVPAASDAAAEEPATDDGASSDSEAIRPPLPADANARAGAATGAHGDEPEQSATARAESSRE